MQRKPELKLDWCSYEAAKYAVMHWHYSRAMPAAKLNKIGIWEDDRFVGVIIFGRGATPRLLERYGLKQTEGCELVRIAMRDHYHPVSRCVAIAIKILKKHNPGLRLIVSFADPEQNHKGGIYQAGNWIYTGRTQPESRVLYKGRIMHRRSAGSVRGSIKGLVQTEKTWKHRYLYPLDKEMRIQVEALRQPYPKAPKA